MEREYRGGRDYSKYLYEKAVRKWILDLKRIPYRLDQRFVTLQIGLSWPAWRAIIAGGKMKMSTFFKICHELKIPIEEAIAEESKMYPIEEREYSYYR